MYINFTIDSSTMRMFAIYLQKLKNKDVPTNFLVHYISVNYIFCYFSSERVGGTDQLRCFSLGTKINNFNLRQNMIYLFPE